MKQKQLLLAISSGLISLGMAGTVNAALIERLGGLAYYDDVADLTWLADANANGIMLWQAANDWAAGLTVGGVSGWRLPVTIDTGTPGCNYSVKGGTDCGYNVDTTTGEMANMFYNVLGNLAYSDTNGVIPQPGYGLQNTGPFSNIQSSFYWSATEYAPNTDDAWGFGMNHGSQVNTIKGNAFHAWAVQSGDIVPVPAAMWLFGSGLLGLVAVARRKK